MTLICKEVFGNVSDFVNHIAGKDVYILSFCLNNSQNANK